MIGPRAALLALAAACALPACAGSENPDNASAAVTDDHERGLEARAAEADNVAAQAQSDAAQAQSDKAARTEAEARGAAAADRDVDRADAEEAARRSR